MKQSAEEILLRKMEELVMGAYTRFGPTEFKKALTRHNKHCIKVISYHRRMIDIWEKMNARMQRKAKILLAKEKK